MSQSIFGTLVLLGTASVVGLPLGILGGIYQLEAKAGSPPWSGSSRTS